jgi:hypothetical protein
MQGFGGWEQGNKVRNSVDYGDSQSSTCPLLLTRKNWKKSSAVDDDITADFTESSFSALGVEIFSKESWEKKIFVQHLKQKLSKFVRLLELTFVCYM